METFDRFTTCLVAAVILLATTLLMSCREQRSVDPVDAYTMWAGQKPDSTVTVLHGQYWQSGHWSLEYEVYLEMKVSAAWREAFFEQNQFELSRNRHLPANAPAWFKPTARYRYRESATSAYGACCFDDPDTGRLFFFDMVL